MSQLQTEKEQISLKYQCGNLSFPLCTLEIICNKPLISGRVAWGKSLIGEERFISSPCAIISKTLVTPLWDGGASFCSVNWDRKQRKGKNRTNNGSKMLIILLQCHSTKDPLKASHGARKVVTISLFWHSVSQHKEFSTELNTSSVFVMWPLCALIKNDEATERKSARTYIWKCFTSGTSWAVLDKYYLWHERAAQWNTTWALWARYSLQFLARADRAKCRNRLQGCQSEKYFSEFTLE